MGGEGRGDGQDGAEQKARILLAAARVLATRSPMLEACSRIGQVIGQELGWDYVAVWVLDSSAWVLCCAENWIRPGCGLSPAFAERARTVRLGPGVGLPGRAFATRQVQWFLASDETGAAGVDWPRAGTCVPVRCEEDVLALIEILGDTPRAGDDGMTEVLDTIGVQIALAELRDRAEVRSELAQRELEEAREHLESIMMCAPGNIATIGKDDKLLFLNRGWPMLGERQAVGESWRTLAEPASREPMAAALTKVFSLGEHDFHNVAIKGADGRPRWLSNHVGPVRIGGQITAAVVISQDVTKAQLAQADLADAQRLASVGTLAAGVAHEINTPVQFVTDSVHFLRDATADMVALIDKLAPLVRMVTAAAVPAELLDAATEATGAIENADLDYLRDNMPTAFARALDGLDRVATIVRSMKEFAHPPQQEMAPADINRAIQSTLTVATSEYKYVADLETELGDLPNVVCHVNDLNQAVLNIVVNAAHAIGDTMKQSGQRGRIKVKTEQQGTDVAISISDTGGGIPEAIRSRIFDPFFTTKEVGRGTGQGLAIARAMIQDKHGGDLSFDSHMGLGTTFVIRLPVAGKPATR